MEQKNSKNYFIIAAIVVVVLGLASGVVGEMMARSYLLGTFGSSMVDDVNFSDANRSNLIIREAKKVVVEQNDKVSETSASVSSGIVGIYKKKAAEQPKGASLEGFYDFDSSEGEGLIITSDGWIVTSYPALAEKPTSLNDFVVITKDRKIYPIDRVVPDKFSKFYFLHIQAKDLPVRNFADRSQLKNGQLVLSVGWNSTNHLNSIVNSQKELEPVESSDGPGREIELAFPLNKDAHGPALYNLAGDVIGLIDEEGRIASAGHFSPVITSLFRDKEVRRPSLGVFYADLTELIDIKLSKGDKEANMPTKGALIIKNAKGVAVVKGGPADLAGLREGDIIVSVGNVELNESVSLTDAIERFVSGNEVVVSFVRDGKKMDAKVKLGQMK